MTNAVPLISNPIPLECKFVSWTSFEQVFIRRVLALPLIQLALKLFTTLPAES